jgi:hypothetical protein
MSEPKPIERITVVLEEKAKKGETPLADVSAIMQSGTVSGPMSKNRPTPIIRDCLRAVAENIALFKRAQQIGIAGQDLSFSGIIKFALSQSVRFKEYADKQNKK